MTLSRYHVAYRRIGVGTVTALALVVALGSCTLRRPEPAAGVDWSERRARMLALTHWRAQGRIAVKGQTGGGQGDLQWEQDGAATRIRVSGPFGAGAYEIRWDPSVLSIRSPNGEFSRAYSGPDAAEQFLGEQLGWSFPATSVRYWILGVPDPGFPAAEHFSPDGPLLGLDQNGWSVTYERFASQSGLVAPAKMTLQNARARVRLVVDRWNF